MKVVLLIGTVLIVSSLVVPGDHKQLTRCQVTKELIKSNFSRTFISNWVCLVDNESGRNTSKVTQKSDGSSNYGIFQINSKNWCQEEGARKKPNNCAMSCNLLIDDNISDDAACANKIFNSEGFKNWPMWEKRCKDGRLPDISKCPDF